LTLEKANDLLESSPDFFKGVIFPDDVRRNCVRLVGTLCLLGDNHELIEPEVLEADQGKLDNGADIKKLVDKAHRRGKFGWSIGKGIEMIPHYRRPHPALVWTGEGRTVPKIILRKGSIIHRDAVESIPTGFEDGPHEP
jgi:hypothetical protein